ncbi:MAG: ATP-dependent zinc protease [Planctomycetales bacterium]|nr:ATP-dependent zinc protease [Planctomycetales bacterium]
MVKERARLPVIGWREWVGLPDLGIARIKAKVDSGARSSSLHAFDLKSFSVGGQQRVRFKIHPIQRRRTRILEVESVVYDERTVRSSSGQESLRPVIVTNVSLLGVTWPVELTLANRDSMGFRMLLGRQAFRDRFLVDGGHSYYGGRPKKAK